jgi:excisionase family DNA binding protein
MRNEAPQVRIHTDMELSTMSTERYQQLIFDARGDGLQAWQHDDGSLGLASYDCMAEYVASTGDEGWTEIEPPATMTVSEASDWYSIPKPTLYRAAAEGRLDARKSGGTWLVERQAMERYAAEYEPRQ